MACFAIITNASSLIVKTDKTFGRRTRVATQTTQGCSRTRRDRHSAWMVRGGYQHRSSSSRTNGGSSSRGHDTFSNNDDGADHVVVDNTRGGTTATDSTHLDLEKIAADLRAKKEHIATHINDRKEAIAADLKAKQEKIADEVLRERSPEAFGELGGHASSYDSATAVRGNQPPLSGQITGNPMRHVRYETNQYMVASVVLPSCFRGVHRVLQLGAFRREHVLRIG